MYGARPSVTVVVPVYRGGEQLQEQLVALSRQDLPGPWDLVLSDNEPDLAATRSLLACVQSLPAARVIDSSSRPGNAGARNAGAGATSSDLILFCDQDDVVPVDWASCLVSALEVDDVAVGAFDLHDALRHQPSETNFRGPYTFLPYGLSASMGVRRTAFEQLNGFDETYASATDVDFCWRAQVAGLSLHCDASNVTWKRRKEGARNAWRQRRSFGYDDAMLYRRFSGHGMPRNTRQAAKAAGWLVVHAPAALAGRDRDTWIRVAGQHYGRLAASRHVGTWYP